MKGLINYFKIGSLEWSTTVKYCLIIGGIIGLIVGANILIKNEVDWTSIAISGFGLGITVANRHFKIKYGTAIGVVVIIIGMIASLD